MILARGIVDSRYNFAVLASAAQDRIVSRWLQDRRAGSKKMQARMLMNAGLRDES